jgi:hypothetical protein
MLPLFQDLLSFNDSISTVEIMQREPEVYSVIRLRAGRMENRKSVPRGTKSVSSSAPTPAVGRTQLPVQWVPGFYPCG